MLDAAGEQRIHELLERPYRLVIQGEPADGYLAEAPELPGCFTTGETPSEALDNLREAMAAWFETAIARGIAIPEPEVWTAPARRSG